MRNHRISIAAIVIGVLCLCLSGFMASSMVRALMLRNDIRMDPTIALPNGLDLGEILPGVPRTLKTSVRNVGQAPLEIYEIYTSCNITEAVVRDRTIPPGQETELTITYTPTYGVGQDVEVNVLFKTNDPTRQPLAVLTLFGHTLPGVRTFPGSICLGQITRGSVNEGQVVVATPHQDGPLEIEEIFSSVDGLTLSVSPSPGDGWTKLISSNGSFKIVDYRYVPTETGSISGKVRFILRSDVAKDLSVPFEATVVPAVRLIPRLLVLSDPGGPEDEQMLAGELLAEAPRPISDVQLKGDNPGLSLRWQRAECEEKARLVIGFARDSLVERNGIATIEVTYGVQKEELRLPWRIVQFN